MHQLMGAEGQAVGLRQCVNVELVSSAYITYTV
jgi:hypothetical protein